MTSPKIGRLPVKYDIDQVTVIVDSRNEFEEQEKKFSVGGASLEILSTL